MDKPTLDTLNKPIAEICDTYSDEGLMKLLPVLKDYYNRTAVLDELYTRDVLVPPSLPDYTNVYDRD